MRVLFSSVRFLGHLNPLLPYARALQARGHEVMVSAPAPVAETLREAGMAHAPVDHPDDAERARLFSEAEGLAPEASVDFAIARFFVGMQARIALPGLRDTVRDWRPDLIVRESGEFAAPVAAEEAGVPHVRVAVNNGGTQRDRIRQAAEALDGLRATVGLAPDHGASLRAAPAFTAFPASLDGPAAPEGWPVPLRVRMPREAAKSGGAVPAWAPRESEAFVYLTFGSVTAIMEDARGIYRKSLDAVEGLPLRALLTTGGGVTEDLLGPIPQNVTVEAWVPQGEVLPYADAVMCHGGSGSLLGAMEAGVPVVIAPLFADQPDNARIVDAAGVGVAVFNADADSLRVAMERVLTEARFRTRAREVAREMAAMADMDAAIDAMEAIVAAAGR
jgi:UDP:flavonoid glycosyltransferase YjiC (YdhE family)